MGKYTGSWIGERLIREVGSTDQISSAKTTRPFIWRMIVSNIYGRQNNARNVKKTLTSALNRLLPNQFGLNFGSGGVRYNSKIINMDIAANQNTDVISAGSLKLPFLEHSLHLIICQEVLEHVTHPHSAIAEFHRVLAPGGELVLQLPFIIGYHPGPHDYWRFTIDSYRVLLDANLWDIDVIEHTVGHGSGFHRIITEFVAVHFSIFGPTCYRYAKGFCALIFCPFIAFDILLPYLPEKHRVPGGEMSVRKQSK